MSIFNARKIAEHIEANSTAFKAGRITSVEFSALQRAAHDALSRGRIHDAHVEAWMSADACEDCGEPCVPRYAGPHHPKCSVHWQEYVERHIGDWQREIEDARREDARVARWQR